MRARTQRGAWLVLMHLVLPASTVKAQATGQVGVADRFFSGGSPGGLSRHEPGLFLNARWQVKSLIAAGSAWLSPGHPGAALLDVDELGWRLTRNRWQLGLGVREVYWGVVESQSIADLINQRGPDQSTRGDQKLGQPMVDVALTGIWGRAELYFLPVFRPRPFRGRAGRLWSSLPVDESRPIFAPGAGRRHVDWAARWSRRFGTWDVAASYFRGVARDPQFESVPGHRGGWALSPHYDLSDQLGFDVQWTRGPWLWKLELMGRDRAGSQDVAVAGGVEFAFADYLSVFLEYLFDGRGPAVTTSFEHDVSIGARLLYQDGQVSAGGFIDQRSANTILWLEARRRLSSGMSLNLDARGFLGREAREPPLARRQETSVSLSLSWYW